MARKIAERDGIREGLVCVLSTVEPCRTFSLVWNERSPRIRDARRKCLQLDYYFMDRDLGLIHVKVQTWFPCRIQVYVNGHEWLARQMDRHGVEYVQVDNAFVRLGDALKAQKLADGFERIDWVHVLGRYAMKVNPLLRDEEVLFPTATCAITSRAPPIRWRLSPRNVLPRSHVCSVAFTHTGWLPRSLIPAAGVCPWLGGGP